MRTWVHEDSVKYFVSTILHDVALEVRDFHLAPEKGILGIRPDPQQACGDCGAQDTCSSQPK
ncbi:hypothetical protein QOT17_006770 [Balamuthia mandrillaris]